MDWKNYFFTEETVENTPVEPKHIPPVENKANTKTDTINNSMLFETIKFFAPMIFFVVALYYNEIVFKFSTTIQPLGMSFFYIFLFSVCFSIPVIVLGTSFSKKVNAIIYGVFLGVLELMYLIEYFIYLQFKVCYDLKTIANGSNDVFNGFTKTILGLVFSVPGIIHLLLFSVPVVAFIILIKKKVFFCDKTSYSFRVILLLLILVIHYICLGTIFVNDKYSDSYKKMYNYQQAVSNFGLLTGVRLDLLKITDNSTSIDFDTDPTIPSVNSEQTEDKEGTESTEPTETEEEVFVPKPNQLDIDFSSLAENSEGKISSLNSYVSTLTPSNTNEYTGIFKGKNLIMICAEAFSGYVIDENLTPTLYRLSTKGINFTDYYVPATAGTTGGEYSFIFSMLPVDSGKSMKEMANEGNNIFTMGSVLSRRGYYGKMYHNNTYTYYDRDKTHNNLGYSDGFMGMGNGMENYVKKCWPQSDLEMFSGTAPTYIGKQPFNIYYMSVSGHSEYTKNGNAMANKNWSKVENLPYSDDVKGYIASQLELEAALTDLLNQLETAGILDDTVIVIGADHFPYGLDSEGSLGNMPNLSELYGHEVTNYFERDKNTLIIWSGSLEKEEPIIVDTPVTSLDITPTLLNLFGCKWDSRLFPGRDVFSDAPAIAFNLNYNWKTDLGAYYGGEFHAKDGVTIPDGYVESISKIVSNKINYCGGMQSEGYFKWLSNNTNILEQLKDETSSSSTNTSTSTTETTVTSETTEEAVIIDP